MNILKFIAVSCMFTISPHECGLAHTIKCTLAHQLLLDCSWLNGSTGKGPHSLQKNPQHNFLATGLELYYIKSQLYYITLPFWLLLVLQLHIIYELSVVSSSFLAPNPPMLHLDHASIINNKQTKITCN